jgi:FG-GAP repeat/Secretion system C-terminal sorting domain
MKKLLFLTLAFFFCFHVSAQEWNQFIKAVASDRAPGSNQFGWSAAISGNYAIIGVPYDNNDENGENFIFSSGAAYLFERQSNGTWTEVQKIVASNRAAEDNFGYSVSISGKYAVIGAYHDDYNHNDDSLMSAAGAAYIFERNDAGKWKEEQKITPIDRAPNDIFGVSVSIDDKFLIVGASGQDSSVRGAEKPKFEANAGAAYIFQRDQFGLWRELKKLIPDNRKSYDYFGNSVSISGTYAVVGASFEDEDLYNTESKDNAGSAYVFKFDSLQGSWIEFQKLSPNDRDTFDYFGHSVAINGYFIVVGAINSDASGENGGNKGTGTGAAYIYENDGRNHEVYNQIKKIYASDKRSGDQFGFSVATSGPKVIVGAVYREAYDGSGTVVADDAGAAYIFERINEKWKETHNMVGSEKAFYNYFGHSVAISDSCAIVGAVNEDFDSRGLNVINDAGSAYFYCLGEAPSTSISEIPSQDEVAIYPNPSDGMVNVYLGNLNRVAIKVYGMEGQLVYQKDNINSTSHNFRLNESPGIYFIEVGTSGKRQVYKLVKL